MKILIASPEMVPYAKTGGLADVIGALPKELKAGGNDVRVIMPKYKGIENKFKLVKVASGVKINILNRDESADVFAYTDPRSKVTIYFIANDKYFGRDSLYQDKGVDYPDNCERFAYYSKASLEFIKQLGWKPDVLNANDWQSALMIMYIKTLYKEDPFFKGIATVYSIHNIGYLGLFPADQILVAGFGWEYFNHESLEFYGKIAIIKAGIVYADVINTVSEQYSREIQTKEYGHGLEGLLKQRSKDVYGIINGIDYELWNPAKDDYIVRKYTPRTVDLKSENKKALQKQNKLPQQDVPLIGIISRLADQKGFDILAADIENIMHHKLQFVLLGTGDQKYHELFLKMKEKYPEHIGVNLGFDAALAQLIYAGSDMFLMPSCYEPCGLGQLISYKYGTVPIVRKTGGLADTVIDGKTGFVFEEYTPEALDNAIKRAINAYKNKDKWKALMIKDMNLDFSWKSSAIKYADLYRTAIAKVKGISIIENKDINDGKVNLKGALKGKRISAELNHQARA